ncbi:MAG: hypothetical protein ACTSWI_00445, partial [Alphaproteobacteria bacterium]
EDLLGWDLYRFLVNESMNLHADIQLSTVAAAAKESRIVKLVEQSFQTMPPGIPEFTHYEPARFLLGISPSDQQNLPGLDAALEAFENLFKELNALLPKSGAPL